MKKFFEAPEVEILMFNTADAILTSSNNEGDIDFNPWGGQVDNV